MAMRNLVNPRNEFLAGHGTDVKKSLQTYTVITFDTSIHEKRYPNDRKTEEITIITTYLGFTAIYSLFIA